jgi:hypothetical protein
MARGTQLQALLAMTRAEARHSTHVALGRNSREALIELINRVQQQLWLDHDWEHMKVNRDVAIGAAQQFHSFPVDLEFERVIWVKIRPTATAQWEPGGDASLDYGITTDQYNVHDSEAGATADPVRRWAYHADDDDDGDQIEVWPLASTDDQVLRLRGIRKLTKMVADTDVCELDDMLIATMAAAELLAHDSGKDAQAKLAAGQKIFRRLTGRMSKQRMFVMGGGVSSAEPALRLRAVYNDRTP